MTLQRAQQILAEKTDHVQPVPHGNRDRNRLNPHLYRLPMTKSW
jgi:hypothetical protein